MTDDITTKDSSAPLPDEPTVDPETDDAVYVDSLTATFSAIASAEADEIHASGSAIGSANAGELNATASAIGLANVDGDAHITVSAVPIVRTTGGATFSQSYASAVLVGEELQIHQAAAPMMIGKTIDATQVGAAVMIAGDADVKHSTVGFLLSRNANVSEDSRVLLSTRAAVIIACALLGGFAVVAIALVMSAQRVARWRPIDLSQLPELPKMPDFPWSRHD